MTGVAGLILGLVISPGASSDDQQLEDAVAKAETRAQRLAADVEDKEDLLAEADASEERAVADALADQKTQQAQAVKVAVAAERTRQNARLKKAVAQARAKERDKIESAAPTLVDAEDDTDPRFDTCGAANAAGYGNYRSGVDPEYDWYDDRDNDGVVCE